MVKFNAAVLQMSSGIDVARNIKAMQEGINAAVARGADFIQTPEMTGLVQQDRAAFFNAVPDQASDVVAQAASNMAKQHSVFVHIGSTPVRIGDQMAANRSYLFDRTGREIARYDKIHMFDVDLDNGESWRESAVYEPGKNGVIANAAGASIGLAICYDCRFPELHTAYARSGVEVLTGPSCFTRQTGKAHWHTLLRSRAIENGAYMIAAAQGGTLEDGRETFGHSIVIDPWGTIIAEVQGEEPGLALAEIDTQKVVDARAKIPNLKNNRPFNVTITGAGVESAA